MTIKISVLILSSQSGKIKPVFMVEQIPTHQNCFHGLNNLSFTLVSPLVAGKAQGTAIYHYISFQGKLKSDCQVTLACFTTICDFQDIKVNS